ncbi:hypothetical protein GQ457_01G006330 [Hibiscus cannabinus]
MNSFIENPENLCFLQILVLRNLCGRFSYFGRLKSNLSLALFIGFPDSSQFTQVELRSLKSSKEPNGKVTILGESYTDMSTEFDFETFLRVYLNMQAYKCCWPGTIDERAINTKRVLNPWERNENHTLCLNSAKAIGCTVVNIGTQIWLKEGLVQLNRLLNELEWNIPIIRWFSSILFLIAASSRTWKTPQLVELVEDSNADVEELMGLAPEKVLLKWMNFHLNKAGYEKLFANFSSDVKDAKAYTYLLNVLAPEYCNPLTLDTKDPVERAKLVLDHAERMGCKRYLRPKDIVEGSTNLNLAFVAQIFHERNGLSTDSKKISFAERMTDDVQISREGGVFDYGSIVLELKVMLRMFSRMLELGKLFINRFTMIFEEYIGGICSWISELEACIKTPIKFPFRKVENGNQVVKIGKQLKFSVSLRSRSRGKEITDADILNWANRNQNFRKNYSKKASRTKPFHWAVLPRTFKCGGAKSGQLEPCNQDEEKRLNATYIISVARKLGCSIFLLPEDIMEVRVQLY